MIKSSVKRWTKYISIFLGTVVILGLVLVTVALIFCDDDDYRKLAVWGVTRVSGYRMIVEGPFAVDLSANPSLTAERIRFEGFSGGPSPHLKSIGRFHLKIALKPLLLGTFVVKQLQVADAIIEDVNIRPEKNAESRLTGGLPEISLPIFESLSLKNIKLTDSSRQLRFLLNQLALDDVQDSGPLNVMGAGSVNGTKFQIDGRLGAFKKLFDRKQPYPLDLNLKFADLALSVAGTVADYENGAGLDMQVAADGRDLTKLLKLFQVDFQFPGQLKLKARLSGDLAAPRVSDLKLAVSGDPSVEISAEGDITNLGDGDGTDILLSVLCRNEDLLHRIFPDDWKVLEEFKFDGALRKVPDGYRIEKISSRVVNNKGINLQTGGWLRLGSIREDFSVKAVGLDLHLTPPHTESIRPLLIDAIPEIGSVDGRARLTGPVEHLALEDIILLRGGSGPVRVETRGRIGWIALGDDKHLSGMDLKVSIQAEQSTILSTFYGVPIEEIGSVSITGRVTGATDRFQLKDIEFDSRDAKGLETKMSGGIDFTEQANGELLGDVRFKLGINSPDMGAAEPLLGANLVPALGPVSAKALIRGTTDILSVEDVDITAGTPDNVQIKWQGRIGKFPLGGDRPIAEVQTFGALQAARSSDFAALFGIKLPDIGPVHATWREIDRRGTYGVEDVKFVAGDGERFKLSATGRVASVIQHKKPFLDGLDLKLSLRASDTHNIFKLLGMQFPDLGAVNGRLALTGGRDKLVAGDLQLTVRSPKGLEIGATGGVGYIGLAKDLPVRDIDLSLTAQAPDLSALPLEGGWLLPNLGPLDATARVGGRDSSVNVEIKDIRAGPQHKPLLQMQGTLSDIGQREQMKLALEFKADTRPWFEKFIQREIAKSPHVAGTINLSGVGEQVRIDKFQLSTAEMGGLTVLANGRFKPGLDSPEVELQVISKTQDPAAWAALFGMTLPQLSPLTIDGRYSVLKNQRIFEGETRLGNTRFQTDARQPIDDPRLRLVARLSSPAVHLNDLGLYPGGQEERTPGTQPAARIPKTSFINDHPLPLDNLQSNDFSLNIHADRVIGKNIEIGPVGMDVALKDGQLRIGTSEMSYRQGQLSLESSLDTTGMQPQVSLKMAAEDMDIDDILSYMHEPLVLEGQLNLALELQSRGRSSRELAANLSGEFGVAIENGKIQRGVEMIASDALDLLFTAPAKNTLTDLNCLACRLDFENGVGTIQVLYLDTPGVRARGFGSINLASETVDMVIKPGSKRRFFGRSSPIRITGKLNDPAIKKIPANEAAILAGQLAVPIIALPARALGLLWSLIRDDKDENSPCLTGALQKAE